MRDIVTHRGPDGHGVVLFHNNGERTDHSVGWQIGLAHRRLSIIDLSKRGHQPMCYRDKYWIAYNGEIYNYIELRTQLIQLGHKFISKSDTEVLLAAYAEWGTNCFARFRGMWSIVIFDIKINQIICSRDRLGIKPLYIWETDGIISIV